MENCKWTKTKTGWKNQFGVSVSQHGERWWVDGGALDGCCYASRDAAMLAVGETTDWKQATEESGETALILKKLEEALNFRNDVAQAIVKDLIPNWREVLAALQSHNKEMRK